MKTEVADILLEKYGKKNPPTVKAGDTVRVHQRIKEGEKERIQIFEGLVIATKHGQGLDGTFTVRKIAAGAIGVERTYPLHSPNILKVERTKTAKVVRAKLYYMRDRRGKSARFKVENGNYAEWHERDAEKIEEQIEAQVAADAESAAEEKEQEAAIEAVETVIEGEASTESTEEIEAPSETPAEESVSEE